MSAYAPRVLRGEDGSDLPEMDRERAAALGRRVKI